MDCTRHSGSTRCLRQGPAAIWISLASILPLAANVAAQPAAVTPEQVNRLHQLTNLGVDWTATSAFDLSRSVELLVTVEGLFLPGSGNAELLFTPDGQGVEGLPLPRDVGPVYHATLQLADEVRRLRLDEHRLRRGVRARILGWPATSRNTGPSVLLVDEIELLRGGGRFALHDYPRMRRYRQRLAAGDRQAP